MTDRFIIDDAGTLIDTETRNTYDIVEEILPLLNELNNAEETKKELTKICKKYQIDFKDVPEILEEYILIDNEVIEQKNIENMIKEAYQNERTALGKSILKQLLERIQWLLK